MIRTACHKPITWGKKQGTEEVQTLPPSNSTHGKGVRGDKEKETEEVTFSLLLLSIAKLKTGELLLVKNASKVIKKVT